MPKLTSIQTGKGDDGTTSLTGGRRVPKDSPRVVAYGTVDELNAMLGVVCSETPAPQLLVRLRRVQNELFHLGADLSTPEEEKSRRPLPAIEKAHVERLGKDIDDMMETVGPLENFVLPGGARSAALLHVARTVCRRAEREVVALAREEPINRVAIAYLNRLSDALFAMALVQNRAQGVAELFWDSRAVPSTE
ncbi:MAG: ATP:cob(I)alamin adenosyltransferase [Chloroflexi bacterium RBG_16_64_43]|nr:MAG: ATP:cob(I)alamin adenosyltransferase [Chloroflexi bacterium RBG_16_64_43]